jgi:hypothetical protein
MRLLAALLALLAPNVLAAEAELSAEVPPEK